MRDYIHVVDLAKGHCNAVKYAREHTGCDAINLGTGKGYSVLDIVHAFEAATGVKVPYEIAPRRAGDIPTCYADPSKAKRVLGWEAQYGLEDMCRSAWNYIQKKQEREGK